MPKYFYNARDKNGKMVTGNMDAPTRDQFVSRLQTMGLFPISISDDESQMDRSLLKKMGSQEAVVTVRGRVKTRDVTRFTRQLSDLLASGLTLTSALRILTNQTESPRLKEVLKIVGSDVQGGSTLAEAMGRHPRVFSRLFVSMIRAGEIGGLLENVLIRLADFLEKEDELKGKILSALAYPMVMLFVGFSAILLLITYVIPRFVKMFDELGADLPLPTKILIGISGFFQSYWLFILVGLVVFGIIVQRTLKTTEGRRMLHLWQLKIPLIGDLILKREIAQFARTFGELLRNGVNILQALQISSDTMNNQIMAEEISKIRTNISEGEKVSDPLKNSAYFPPVVVNMIAVGEESGHLENVLTKIAVSYENEVDRSIKTVTSLFEPAIILVMGVIVGAIAISMLLPVFTLNLSMTK